MKNLFKHFAHIYDLHIGEIFSWDLDGTVHNYKIEKTGLLKQVNKKWKLDKQALLLFMLGRGEITKCKFRVRLLEPYFYVTQDGDIKETKFTGSENDNYRLICDNCYKTLCDAVENVNKHTKQSEEAFEKYLSIERYYENEHN